MLQNPTGMVVPPGEFELKSYQFLLFNNLMKRNQYNEDLIGKKVPAKKRPPNMQQVIRTDMERMKSNKVYERKLNEDLYGPRGLNWQCKLQLQRLRSDERDIERDLLRLHRDLAKASSVSTVIRSPSLNRNQAARLSSIAEERSTTSTVGSTRTKPGRSSSISSVRTSVKPFVPIKKQTSTEQSQPLSKHRIRQMIAKTSDDRSPPHHQQHAHTIEQQKRVVEQKLKQFLH